MWQRVLVARALEIALSAQILRTDASFRSFVSGRDPAPSARMDGPSAEFLNSLTESIIGAGIGVHRQLGAGLLESAYCPPLEKALNARGLQVKSQRRLPPLAGSSKRYRVDLLVEGCVIVEVKSVERLLPVHAAQLRLLAPRKVSGGANPEFQQRRAERRNQAGRKQFPGPPTDPISVPPPPTQLSPRRARAGSRRPPVRSRRESGSACPSSHLAGSRSAALVPDRSARA